MTIDTVNVPSSFVTDQEPAVGKPFREMRNAVMKSGPLDHETCELIVTSGFLVQGFELPFKIHALRLLRGGTSKEKLRQMALVHLGAALPLYPVASALKWIDEVEAQHLAEQAAAK